MKSAGNDIVALGLVDKQRTIQPRFYSKILALTEQELYQQPEINKLPFVNYVWLLWSVKESVYKFLKRNEPGLVFSPTNIIVSNIALPKSLAIESEDVQWESSDNSEDLFSGEVNYGPHTLYFRSKINTSWIATVVNDNKSFDDVCWGVKSIDDAGYKQQSTAARLALLNKLSLLFPGELRIEKSPVGYPVVLNDAELLPIPASLAHDGCFVAYSFLLEVETV
jgi:phosphopantetheinyl transferase (holo-ACP synthase)